MTGLDRIALESLIPDGQQRLSSPRLRASRAAR